MPPAYCARGVKQEFGDSGDVTVILASIGKQQIIAVDHLGFAIGKQRKCEVCRATQLPRFVGVCADGNGLDACGFKGG